MRVTTCVHVLASLLPTALTCSNCYGPQGDLVLTRNVRRMQPGSTGATTQPRGPLEWGQLNFLHTTDTHGWLESHIKQQTYSADWGDYVSFVNHMKDMAHNMSVDLLLVDTGDLHDGTGLSDATSPDGLLSNPVFENVNYDLLTIGNHELYVTEVAYETFNNFSKIYEDKYLTSNVQIINPSTGNFEYIGQQYRYFTTEQGLRIMSFGVLYDFTGNSNVSRVIKAADLVQQQWFKDAINFDQPIDLFLILGHNPSRPTNGASTFGTIYSAIRNERPDTPIQIFGGHTHVRDFAVYDDKTTGLESGRYCETLGWLSVSGFNQSSAKNPTNYPNPTRPAVSVASGIVNGSLPKSTTPSSLRYARRYLDWNRLTFAYHSTGSQSSTFSTREGEVVTDEITAIRQELNLTQLYGCAPQTWCASCAPFLSQNNIYSLLSTALSATVVNASRASNARLIIINTGSVRYDLIQGPFTYDDSFIVSPFADAFQFLPSVPFSQASQVLDILNAGPPEKRDLTTRDFGFTPLTGRDTDVCLNPPTTHHHHALRSRSVSSGSSGIVRRQNTGLTPGYTTTDDFGTDGDDTPHSSIPYYSQPNDLQANASFPTDGSNPDTVDLIFLDFIAGDVLEALSSIGANYSTDDVTYYLPKTFTTNSYLPAYAKTAPDWQKNVPNCPVAVGNGTIN
ncbi:MAG: hypothetical protein M1820_006502 [Bogoriella megaspora]|nr:MAG: hypothetical protein M1820_006502 [Bogoriella megaspora]